jgi:hypothetical protein
LSLEALRGEMLWVSQGRKEKETLAEEDQRGREEGEAGVLKGRGKKLKALRRWRVVFLTRGKARAAETEQDRYGAIQMSLHGKAKYLTLALIRAAKPSYPG